VRCLLESCRVVSLWNIDIARAFERVTRLNYIRAGQAFTLIESGDNHAERSHVDAISVSFGGYIVEAVWDAIMEAVRKNIIVVAAAGNYVGWVVEPAAFPHVIAVGGTTPDDAPWNGSGMGPEVDLSAPALCVVHAAYDTDGSETVIAGAGTSHSAPAVAAAAALWLQHHGIDAPKTQFPNTPLQFVFQCVLRLTALGAR
jgi:serine protease